MVSEELNVRILYSIMSMSREVRGKCMMSVECPAASAMKVLLLLKL